MAFSAATARLVRPVAAADCFCFCGRILIIDLKTGTGGRTRLFTQVKVPDAGETNGSLSRIKQVASCSREACDRPSPMVGQGEGGRWLSTSRSPTFGGGGAEGGTGRPPRRSTDTRGAAEGGVRPATK